jgi:hypothetical protein
MKRTSLSLIALFAALQLSYAQWQPSGSNTYYNTGNVGIGTINPDALLQVTKASEPNTPVVMQKWAPTVAGYNLTLSNYNSSFGIDYRFTQLHNYTSQPVLTFQAGNVGIGTTNPLAKLDVVGGDMQVYNSITGSTNLNVGSAATGKTYIRLTTSSDVNGYGIIQSVLTSGSAWGNTFINPQGGDVGIGTTDTHGYKLAVNGSVRSKSVKVELANWPDFVFLEDYKLPTLAEVKTYIDKNQHLPDMPSASEVHANGLDLGGMNRLLLKKVEELTLYLMEEHDKNIKQESRIKTMEAKLDRLSK